MPHDQTADAVPPGPSNTPLRSGKRAPAAFVLVAALATASVVSITATGGQARPPAAQGAGAQPPPAARVPGQACLKCHRDVVRDFGESMHGKSARFLADSRAATCETCHGDGQKHIESAEPKDIQSPPK